VEEVLVWAIDLMDGLVCDGWVAERLKGVTEGLAATNAPTTRTGTMSPFVEQGMPRRVTDTATAATAAGKSGDFTKTISHRTGHVYEIADKAIGRSVPVRHERTGVFVIGPEVFENTQRRVAVLGGFFFA